MKTKICRNCKLSLPLEAFTSTQARYCQNCKVIVRLEQQKAMIQRSYERSKTRKPRVQKEVRLSDLKNKLQIIFNRYIRLRDKDLPCISCGQFKDNYDAGHFWSVGANSYLRYNEDNVHKQCSPSCNRWKNGNPLEYRIGLVKKIGEKRVQWLDEHRKDKLFLQRVEVLEMIETYKSKLKDSQLEREE